MATTNYTPLLGLALPTTGDLSGTWGTEVNNAITSLLDSAVAGTTTLSADSNTTLTTTNGASNQSRNAVLLCTGARTALRTITAQAQSKAYIIINATTGGYGVKIVGAGPTTGVTVTNGEKALVAWDGSDFVIVSSSIIDLTSEVTGTLPIANGGTGSASTTYCNLTTNVTGTLPIANGGTGSASTTYCNLTTNVTGTLPIANGGTALTSLGAGVATFLGSGLLLPANGGTGITSLGAGVATFLGTPSSANLAAAVTNETGSGSLVFGTSPTIATATITSPTITTPQITAEREVAASISASAIDLSTGNYFYKTISGNVTFTVSNVPTTGVAQSFILELTNAGAHTITWFAGVTFPNGVAPTLTPSGRDVLGFFTRDGGTTWSGFVVGQNLTGP